MMGVALCEIWANSRSRATMPERRGRVTFGLADADTLVNPALPATRWRAKGGLRSTDRRVGLARDSGAKPRYESRLFPVP
jgi:hypothetical protein